jgi:tetratricopeptide (TPR) repeat protein
MLPENSNSPPPTSLSKVASLPLLWTFLAADGFTAKMSGQIFISYRRADASYPAGRLYDRLLARLPKNQIFVDVDLDPGIDFVQAIETSVGSCDVLIAVIGKRWLLASDEEGKRRLDNTEDFVRLEISTALKRSIGVIPVFVDGASMPPAHQLPYDLKLLARRNALEVSHNRFNADFGRLVAAIEKVLGKAEAERKQSEETPKPKPANEGDEGTALKGENAPSDERGYDKGISDFTELIRSQPSSVLPYYSRGLLYDANKEYDKAISDFTEAIRLEPNLPSGYYYRAKVYESQGELDKAQADFEKASQLRKADTNLPKPITKEPAL